MEHMIIYPEKAQHMNKTNLNKISAKLQKAFLACKNKKELFNFLVDLLTQKEILDISQRLDIASRLNKAQSYKKIAEETWASSTTIARAAKFLKWKHGGYKKVLWLPD